MPPRHGKSELASRRFPAWYLGRHPDHSVIAASYNSDLATDFGRNVRGIVSSEEYQSVFKTKLAQDSAAANRWHTDRGGAYVAAGVGTAVTGRGANILLIDDPVKDREEAESEIRRQRVWDWYTSTAYTRLAPGGAIIIIQTRWHEDDLAGRAIESEPWEVLELPAINEQGEALWAERYDIKSLERIKNAIGPRDWSALYQQAPSPDEGLFFKSEWFKYYDTIPENVHTYGASDYAVTDGGGDYTVHGVMSVDEDLNVYVTDFWRGQTTSDVWIEQFIDMVRDHQPLNWGEEQGQIIKSVGPFIDRRMNERKTFCSREQFTSASDKATRARSFQALMASGKVFFPKSAPWLADLINEMLTFPAGKNDDQVDVLSLFGRMLADLVGKGLETNRTEKKDKWDKAFDQAEYEEGASWKTM